MAILQILRFSQQVKATSLDYFPNTHPIKGLWKIVFFGKQFWSVFNHLVNTKFYWGGGVLTLERSKVEFRFLKIISDLLFFGKTEILTIERSLQTCPFEYSNSTVYAISDINLQITQMLYFLIFSAGDKKVTNKKEKGKKVNIYLSVLILFF